MVLDAKDQQILELLKENGRISTYGIARKTRIPVTTIYHRIKKLENKGIIKRYTVVLDQKKAGKIITACILIHFDISVWGKTINREQFRKRLLCLPGIEEISYITGQFDILLKGYFTDFDEFDKILPVTCVSFQVLARQKPSLLWK